MQKRDGRSVEDLLRFRAWNTFHNKWVKHFYITENGLIYNMGQPHRDLIGAVQIEQSGLILMQSTGLFDKNGTEIFEGDVVKIVDENGDSEISAVAFKEGALGMTITGAFVPFVTLIMEATVDYTLEVIGNIYENPELVEDMQ